MTISSSKVRFNIDALLALRPDSGQSDITADANTGVLSLDRLGAEWNAGEIATPLQYAIFGAVTKIDATTGDETYDLKLEVDSSEAFSSPVVVSTVRVNKLGQFIIPVVREQLLAADPAAAFLRIGVDVAGTTPILNFWAYAAPYQGGK